MLPRNERISSKQMRALPRPTVRFNRDVLSISYVADEDRFAVAIIVSKKVSKKAVVRNRIRRWLYAVAAENKNQLPKGQYIVRINPAARSVSRRVLQSELVSLFGEIIKAR